MMIPVDDYLRGLLAEATTKYPDLGFAFLSMTQVADEAMSDTVLASNVTAESLTSIFSQLSDGGFDERTLEKQVAN